MRAFLEKKIGFLDIHRIINTVLSKHKLTKNPSLKQTLSADKWARREVENLIRN